MKIFPSLPIYLKEALELEPDYYVALALLGGALAELGEYDEALISFQKSLNIHFNIETLSMMGYTYALAGNYEKAQEIIKQVKSQPKDNSKYEIKLAMIYLALGEKETAYNFLEQSFEQHDIDLVSLNFDPRWKTIQHEPRFKELVRKVGIPIN